jgi:tetratricopeptide (TPR) repeat protein
LIPQTACLDANTLVAFAAGELTAARHAQVEAHLDQCPSCAELLREALDGLELTNAGGSPADPEGTVRYMRSSADGFAPLPRGSVIGRYIVLTTIGEGGLGRVYAAYDPELDRQVALKLLRTADSYESEQRLVREARAMAKLSHPNVVPVHDVGTSDRGPFIAMNLVAGGDLQQWLKGGTRRWQEIRDKLVAAGQGLAAAHRAGLVHRDFKASNVLLDDGRVMVTDFGLARNVSISQPIDSLAQPQLQAPDPQLTQAGTLMGTPGYMAPEAFRGWDCDARSDQFSFCVTAYAALCGIMPFPREIGPFISAVASGQLAPARDTRAPAWLRRAIERGLAANPAARFPSMEPLLAEMQRDRRVRRRWWGGIGSAVVVAAAAVGITLAVLEPEPTQSERNAVDTAVDQAHLAASASYYVYPPLEAPDYPTAFRKVLELEAMDGAISETASEAASELRDEFAGTLVRLGNEYWDRPGGTVFASEYYAAALVFDPDNERALERMVQTPVQLDLLRARARSGDFSPAELSAAEALAALADPDPEVRRERLDELIESDKLPLVAQARIEEVLEPESETPRTRRPKGRRSEPKEEPAAPAPGTFDPFDEPGTEPAAPEAADDADPSARPIDKRAAKAAVKRGQAAIRAADMRGAEQAFMQALQHDPHLASAYAGLAEVAFESKAYSKAVSYAKKATRRAPRVAKYRMQLGDAYLKVLDLKSARSEYQEAKRLGHPQAAQRLATVESKIGK